MDMLQFGWREWIFFGTEELEWKPERERGICIHAKLKWGPRRTDFSSIYPMGTKTDIMSSRGGAVLTLTSTVSGAQL